MMEYDIYCAICGGPFGHLHERERHVQDREEYISESGAIAIKTWLGDIRVIGENHGSTSPCKAWLSGPAAYQDWGEMLFELDHELTPGHWSVRMYAFEGSEDPWFAPFHTRCYQIFCRYMGVSVSQLDKEAFLEALKSLARYTSTGTTCLDIDYGNIWKEMDGYSRLSEAPSYVGFDPVKVRGLEELYAHLPQTVASIPKEVTWHREEADPFSKLSSDVLLLIVSQMDPIDSLFNARQASPAFANLELTNRFWRRRLAIDMTWLWDLPQATSHEQIDEIDWRKVYHKLHWGSTPSSQKKVLIRGLCNRRRIWEHMCPVFAEAYLEMKARHRLWTCGRPTSLACSFDQEAKQLITPKPTHTKLVIATLLNELADLADVQPELMVDWSIDGYLVAIRIFNGGDSTQSTAAAPLAHTTDTVHIPKGDWPAGFIITSRSLRTDSDSNKRRQIVGLEILFLKRSSIQLGSGDGDKRLIHVHDGRFVVALKMTCSAIDGTLCRIALIEQDRVAANGCERVFASNSHINRLSADLG